MHLNRQSGVKLIDFYGNPGTVDGENKAVGEEGEDRGIKKGRIDIQPRCKIQYPMKNRNKDACYAAKRCINLKIIIQSIFTIYMKKRRINAAFPFIILVKLLLRVHYFLYDLHGALYVWQGGGNQVGCIVKGRIGGGNAADRRVEIIESFFLDAVSDLG